MEDVFNFDDFLSGKFSKPIIKESIEDQNEKTNVTNLKVPVEKEESKEVEQGEVELQDELQDEFEHEESLPTTESIQDSFYKLYKDINEEFICDISIEGSSPENTYARIIVESTEWSLIFPGEIKNGKCIVPIKKLGILKEGEIGIIKLEVVAEGNLFIPWEDTFKVKLSKKVTVTMNENRQHSQRKPIDSKVGIKVNVR